MKKIIIQYTSNLCQRVEDLFSIQLWIEAGYEIEYWDLSAITFQERLAPIHIEGLKERVIATNSQYDVSVKRVAKESFFLMWFGFCAKTEFIFRIMSKYHAEFGVICNGLLPTVVSQSHKITLKRLKNSCRERYYSLIQYTPLYKPATFSFITASAGKPRYKVDERTIHAKCNSGDYEAMLRLSGRNICGKDYFLFLDQYIPFHNDTCIAGNKPIDAERYFKSLNEFFDGIEKAYGMPVIIAAHPSAKRYETDNPFNGREYVFNKTMELASQCRAIITHFTTAISSAVVYNKPSILLSSDELITLRSNQYVYMQALHEELGAPIINMDHTDESSFEIPVVNTEKYKEYKYKYLTNPETENTNNFINISSVINKIC